jgi:hypothetical protein
MKWNLAKKNKARDMAAVHRLYRQRQACQKNSDFKIRGRPCNVQDVQRYIKRKVRQDPAFLTKYLDAPTPEHIAYRTPSMSPEPLLSEPPSVSGRVVADKEELGLPRIDSNRLSSLDEQSPQLPLQRRPEASFSPPNDTYISDLQSLHQLVLCSPSIPLSMTLPQQLLVAEKLGFTLNIFIARAFYTKKWIVDDDGWYRDTTATYLDAGKAAQFRDCCQAAARLFKQGSLVRVRQILSNACKLVPTMLRVQGPHVIIHLFTSLMRLMSVGLQRYADVLRHYFSDMAAEILPAEDYWLQVCKLLAEVDIDQLQCVIETIWRSTTDSFGNTTNVFDFSAVLYRLTLTHEVVYYRKDFMEAVKRAKTLLADCEKSCGRNHPSCLSILTNIARALREGGREHAREVETVAQDMLARAKRSKWPRSQIYEIYALSTSAHAHHLMGNQHQAEANIRQSIRMIERRYGEEEDTWRLQNMIWLEGWLREWGHEHDANELRREIDKLIGPDDLEV